jgi:hypothetical protein
MRLHVVEGLLRRFDHDEGGDYGGAMSRKPGAKLFSVAAIMAVAIKGALPPNSATMSIEVAYPVSRMRVWNISTWAAS